MRVPARYTGIAITLHWVIAVLILANMALAWSTGYLSDEAVRPVIDTHKSIGISVLGLVILRILWRATHKPPPLPPGYPPWERRAAHAAHLALYVVLLALPLSGWLHDSAWNAAASHPFSLFGIVPWFRIGLVANLDPATKEWLHTDLGTVHELIGYALLALLAAHVLGALKHQWLDREPELQRMWPGRTGRRDMASAGEARESAD